MAGAAANKEELQNPKAYLEALNEVMSELQARKRVVSAECGEFFKIIEEYEKAKERIIKEQRLGKLAAAAKPQNSPSQTQTPLQIPIQNLDSLAQQTLEKIQNFLGEHNGQKAQALRAYLQPQAGKEREYQKLLNWIDLLAPQPEAIKEIDPFLTAEEREQQIKARKEQEEADAELARALAQSEQKLEDPPPPALQYAEAITGPLAGERTYLDDFGRPINAPEAAAFDLSAELAYLLQDLDEERRQAQFQKEILKSTRFEFLKQSIDARLGLIQNLDSLLQNASIRDPNVLAQAKAQFQEISGDRKAIDNDQDFISVKALFLLLPSLLGSQHRRRRREEVLAARQLEIRSRPPAIPVAPPQSPDSVPLAKKWTAYQWVIFFLGVSCVAICLTVLTCAAIALVKQTAFWIIPLSAALPLTITMAVLFLVLVAGLAYAYNSKNKSPGAQIDSLLAESHRADQRSSLEIRPESSREYSPVIAPPRLGQTQRDLGRSISSRRTPQG